MDATLNNQHIDPVDKAVQMLTMLDEQTRRSVLERMSPDMRTRVEQRMISLDERPLAEFGMHVKRRLLRETATRIHERRIDDVERSFETAADGQLQAMAQGAPLDPMQQLRDVHPAALARALQGERAEAWALVLDHVSETTQAALRMYLDDQARLAIETARTHQASLSPQLRTTVEKAIAQTVVPRALREHQALMTSHGVA